jgi:hypothetical protein
VFGPVLFLVGVREVVECEVVSRSGAPFRAISSVTSTQTKNPRKHHRRH